MRFNPPPNWPPIPPGWTPPPGWQPDPSWPPPPPGWQLWVAQPPSGRKVGLIVGGLAAVLIVAIGVVVAVVATQRSPEITVTAPTSTSSTPADDEKDIEAVVQQFAKAWNDKDFSAFAPIVCKKMRSADEFNEADFLKARSIRTTMDVSVQKVDVKGDKAVATIEQRGQTPDKIDFVREDGSWKWCEV